MRTCDCLSARTTCALRRGIFWPLQSSYCLLTSKSEVGAVIVNGSLNWRGASIPSYNSAGWPCQYTRWPHSCAVFRDLGNLKVAPAMYRQWLFGVSYFQCGICRRQNGFSDCSCTGCHLSGGFWITLRWTRLTFRAFTLFSWSVRPGYWLHLTSRECTRQSFKASLWCWLSLWRVSIPFGHGCRFRWCSFVSGNRVVSCTF